MTVSGVASPPGNFALVTPVNGATGVTQGPLFLDWDPAPGAANYSVIVDDDPAFGSPLFSIGATLATRRYSLSVGTSTMTGHYDPDRKLSFETNLLYISIGAEPCQARSRQPRADVF